MPELQTEFLFEARIPLHPPLDAGQTPEGRRMVFAVGPGRFEGPRLRGRVAPMSGADWSRIRPDGSGALDVRMRLETHDGAVVYVHWHGRMVASAENREYALDFAEPDDPEDAGRYCFRTSPQFETGDARYAWLNNIVAVSKSRTGDGGGVHEVFAVK